MKEVPINIDTMPLFRYQKHMVEDKRFIPVTSKGSGLSDKDISIIDGKEELDIQARIVSSQRISEERSIDYAIKCENEINKVSNPKNKKEIPIILHFSMMPLCDKFALQVGIKSLDVMKKILVIGTKEYSILFGMERFDYQVLKERDKYKLEKYIDEIEERARQGNFDIIFLNVPGGVNKNIQNADSSFFIETMAQKKICKCILSIPYVYDSKEIEQYVEYIKFFYKIGIDYVCVSNLVVDWNKSDINNRSYSYYTIKKDISWHDKVKYLRNECEVDIVDGDNLDDLKRVIDSFYNVLKNNA